jgi:hypothetical protein
LYKQLQFDLIEGVVGILKSCSIITQPTSGNQSLGGFPGINPINASIDSLRNIYAAEFKNILDDNTVTVIFIEECF